MYVCIHVGQAMPYLTELHHATQMVDPDLGKPSLTEWKVRAKGKDRTLLELSPITGRTHQLRVHLAHIGHPLQGDPFYSSSRVQALSERLCLHAETLSFRHPVTQEPLSFTKPALEEWEAGCKL